MYTSIISPQISVIYETHAASFQWRGEPSASVSLQVPWELRNIVANDLLTPRAHPDYPFLHVKTVQISPIGLQSSGGVVINYEMAKLDVSYARKPTGAYSENITHEVQMISLPPYMFRWQNGSMLAEGEEPSRQMRLQKITHTYDHLRSIPGWVGLDTGKVNSDPITTSQGWTCEAETLLYIGGETSISYDYTGSDGWQLTTSFSYNPGGWNRWWNSVQQQWMELKIWTPGGGSSEGGSLSDYKMYESTSMRAKFTYEP